MKLAIVEWTDAAGNNEWDSLDDVVARGVLPTVTSVGWVIRKTKGDIILASSLCPDLRKTGQYMAIPSGFIKKVTYVGSKHSIDF